MGGVIQTGADQWVEVEGAEAEVKVDGFQAAHFYWLVVGDAAADDEVDGKNSSIRSCAELQPPEI